LARGYRDFLRNWQEYRMHAEQFREPDGERIFVLVHANGRGRSSGIALDELSSKSAAVFHVRDERVIRMTHYFDRDNALADLGLDE
jgi:ketosteroid isomerase-like protein